MIGEATYYDECRFLEYYIHPGVVIHEVDNGLWFQRTHLF